jgi:hypothetical protein
MNPLPKYNEKGELDTRLRVDPVTGDVGIGTPKEKEHMTKDEAIILLCEHFSEGMVRTIVDAIAKDKALQQALEALTDFDYDKRMSAIEVIKEALETKDEPVGWIDSKGNMICIKTDESCRPLYTTPQQRTWVGLSDEEIKEIVGPWGDTPIKGYTRKMFDKIEAKLREKNQ